MNRDALLKRRVFAVNTRSNELVELIDEVLALRARLGIDVGEIDVEGYISDSGATLTRTGDHLRERFQTANHAVACLDYWSRP